MIRHEIRQGAHTPDIAIKFINDRVRLMKDKFGYAKMISEIEVIYTGDEDFDLYIAKVEVEYNNKLDEEETEC